ncbi:MAG: UDP-3-O-acylglucosamine N-acyltransferase [Chlamydiae bacterium]|nr:UDP-3-O-acylglucosamine N-acyltransferase [Chlamydiota bacterium]
MPTSTSYSLEEISKLTSSKLIGDPKYRIEGVETLESASKEQASFLANPLYLKQLKQSKAGVVFTKQLPDFKNVKNYLISSEPSQAFQVLINLFSDPTIYESGFKNVHPTAIVHPTVALDKGITIGPYCVIDQGSKIGANTSIQAHVHIGPHVEIGSNCKLYSQVTIQANCKLGNEVIIQPGAVIGSCGFGYITNEKGHHEKLKQVGRVILEDRVEIGANTTIDRGRFNDTHIASGTKLDNLVQIAHGVKVGENSILVAQVGVSGSTHIGKYNVIAGQAGLVGHIKLTDHVTIAAQSGVTKNIKEPGFYGGSPALPQKKFYTLHGHLRRLDHYVTEIKKMGRKVAHLEKKASIWRRLVPYFILKKFISTR